jgi:hypothetical protein
VKQTIEIIEGVLVEAPVRQNSNRYPVKVEAIRRSFEAEGGLTTYDFRIMDKPEIPSGMYYIRVAIDGHEYGQDVRASNDSALPTEIRWSDHSPLLALN